MMQHNFKIGDTVVRTAHTFRKMKTGDTGVVAGVGYSYIQIEGHFAGEHGGELVRYDCAAFDLVKPQAAPQAAPQPAGGVKYDAGKPRYGLVLGGFPRALERVVQVGTFGANKYSDDGWLTVPNGLSRYNDAMLRHHFAEAGGEELDGESGMLHAAHRAWNALAVLELKLIELEKNNASA